MLNFADKLKTNASVFSVQISVAHAVTPAKAGFRPSNSSNYIIGNKDTLFEKSPNTITRSTFCPNLTLGVYNKLSRHRNARNLYLLGVKYSDAKGGDIQAGISETRHYFESRDNNAIRGVKEELHISINKDSLELFGQKYSHDHFIMREITSPNQYELVDIKDIHPDPSKDNKENKSTVSVYIFGTFDNLLPIIQAYQPPPPNSPDDNEKPKHDPIDHLCMVPFSDLLNFRKY
jgi:hypothetical protein